MQKDDIIFEQLTRIEAKLDDVIKTSSENHASIGFLKTALASLFTAMVAVVGFFIKYKA